MAALDALERCEDVEKGIRGFRMEGVSDAMGVAADLGIHLLRFLD